MKKIVAGILLSIVSASSFAGTFEPTTTKPYSAGGFMKAAVYCTSYGAYGNCNVWMSND